MSNRKNISYLVSTIRIQNIKTLTRARRDELKLHVHIVWGQERWVKFHTRQHTIKQLYIIP